VDLRRNGTLDIWQREEAYVVFIMVWMKSPEGESE